MALDDWLGGLLRRHRPRSVLCLSAQPLPELKCWARADGHALCALSEASQLSDLTGPRYDLALLVDQLGGVERAQGEHLLARLRDIHSDLFYILESSAAPAIPWSQRDFYALGLERLRESGQPGEVYRYDACHYNPKRRWNNPEHWANPEQFHHRP